MFYVPHRNNAVKPKVKTKVKIKKISQQITEPYISIGAIDIHFHGAFGIDLMSANRTALDFLSEELWKKGVAGFCPTTLSVSPEILRSSVSRLGRWIRESRFRKKSGGAIPLGIHLEGPFIHPQACGAHPPSQVRPFVWKELEDLWEASLGTLKILTLAPELLAPAELRRLPQWCERRKILLSLGHSRASEELARQALEGGFRGITHAWNAMGFHHRSPGVLGAAIGFAGRYLELILDGVHVSPTVVHWTRSLHAPHPVCFVSDCVPAAGTVPMESREPGPWVQFGPLRIRYHNGACRLESGDLAGGGKLLTDAFCHWVDQWPHPDSSWPLKLKQAGLEHLNRDPLRVLGIPSLALKSRKVRWSNERGRLTCHPLT